MKLSIAGSNIIPYPSFARRVCMPQIDETQIAGKGFFNRPQRCGPPAYVWTA